MSTGECRLPWWTKEESAATFCTDLEVLQSRYSSSAHLPSYARSTAMLFVQSSNQHEGTLPQGFTAAQTYQLLTEIWDDMDEDVLQAPCQQTWHADGGRGAVEAKAQLLQHMRALKYITSRKGELTADIVKETHAILMKGAVNDTGKKLTVGYREEAAYATTGHVYMDAASIKEYVQDYINMYNSAANKDTDPFQMAAKLFYGLVHLVHPFQNGNGRLGRLLVSFVLMSSGTPFPLPFMNGHHRPAKLYHQIVSRYARLGHCNHMRNYILECCHYRWTDFGVLHEEMHRLGH